MQAVDGQRRRRVGEGGRDAVEDVEEGHAVLGRDGLGRFGVGAQVGVAAFDRLRAEPAAGGQRLLRYRRNEGDARRLGAVVELLRDVAEQPPEVVPERRQAFAAGKRLVRAVEQQDDVRALRLEVAVDRAEVQRPRPQRRLVGRPGEVAHRQLQVGEGGKQSALEVAEELESLGERVAHQADPVAAAKLKRGGVRRGGAGRDDCEQKGGQFLHARSGIVTAGKRPDVSTALR